MLLVQSSKQHVGVSYGWQCPADPVARRTRLCTCAMRTDSQHSAGVEPCDAAPSRTDRMHIDGHRLDRKSIDHATIANLRLAVYYHAHIRGSTTHVQRNDVAALAQAGEMHGTANAAAGAGKQRIDWPLCRKCRAENAAT